MKVQFPQVIAQLSRFEALPQNPRNLLPQILIGETSRQQSKEYERGRQGHDSTVSEAKLRSLLFVDQNRLMYLTKRIFTDCVVVAISLDIQATSIGLEADFRQRGQALQPSADAANGKIISVVESSLCAQDAPFLVVGAPAAT